MGSGSSSPQSANDGNRKSENNNINSKQQQQSNGRHRSYDNGTVPTERVAKAASSAESPVVPPANIAAHPPPSPLKATPASDLQQQKKGADEKGLIAKNVEKVGAFVDKQLATNFASPHDIVNKNNGSKEGVSRAEDGDEDGIHEGLLVEGRIQFDLSIPSSAVEGAIFVLNVVIKLIQAYVNRNKLLKAMESRVLGIQASVLSLQSRSPEVLSAALPGLKTLVTILVDYKKFVQYITRKPSGFFEKTVSFFRAVSDLDNLANFDALFTRALADLAVPLQADQLALMEMQMKTLTAVAADVSAILAKLDEAKVLAIVKRVITNEEALTFWMDCIPDKFQINVREFAAALFMWLTETKGMKVTKKSVQSLVNLVNLCDPKEEKDGGEDAADQDDDDEEGPDEFIDARECNLLFQALDFDYALRPLEQSIEFVRAFIHKKQQKDAKEIAANRALMKKKITRAVDVHKMSANETEYIGMMEAQQRFYSRLYCEAMSVGADGRMLNRTDVQTIYVTDNGSLAVFGCDPTSLAEVMWTGRIGMDHSFTLDIPSDTTAGETMSANGQYRGNLFIAHCLTLSGLRVTFLRLPAMVRWEGFWQCHWGEKQRGDMFFFCEERKAVTISNKKNNLADGSNADGSSSHKVSTDDNNADDAVTELVCLSDDEAGIAVWKGTISTDNTESGSGVSPTAATRVSLVKQYINQHPVFYDGIVTINNVSGLREMKGTWKINEWDGSISTGDFHLWELMPEGAQTPGAGEEKGK